MKINPSQGYNVKQNSYENTTLYKSQGRNWKNEQKEVKQNLRYKSLTGWWSHLSEPCSALSSAVSMEVHGESIWKYMVITSEWTMQCSELGCESIWKYMVITSEWTMQCSELGCESIWKYMVITSVWTMQCSELGCESIWKYMVITSVWTMQCRSAVSPYGSTWWSHLCEPCSAARLWVWKYMVSPYGSTWWSHLCEPCSALS
jgi:hypothetical protein